MKRKRINEKEKTRNTRKHEKKQKRKGSGRK